MCVILNTHGEANKLKAEHIIQHAPYKKSNLEIGEAITEVILIQ